MRFRLNTLWLCGWCLCGGMAWGQDADSPGPPPTKTPLIENRPSAPTPEAPFIPEAPLPFTEADISPLVTVPEDWHNTSVMFEDLQLLSSLYDRQQLTLGPDVPSCPTGRLRCRWQACTVNWRLNSMHLAGCIPEGYWQLPYIQSVPTVETHSGPLTETNPVEPGGHIQEARQIDGDAVKPLRAIVLTSAPPNGKLPTDQAATAFDHTSERGHLPGTIRNVHGHTKYWQASLLNHQPLYFEDASLERHGYSYGLFQPAVSGAKFFGTMPLLPYLMTAEPPHTTEYVLGEGRAGSSVPYGEELPPVSLEGGLVEAGVIVGLIFLIP